MGVPHPRRGWPVYAGLAVLLGGVMWPAWTSTHKLVSGGDVELIHYPWFVLWRQMLAAGQWPWWNAYTLGGLPAFATLQAGYGYPPHWLLSWLPAIRAVNWTIGLHVILAGLGTAWCAGRLGAGQPGQVLAGASYALGSATVARLTAGHLSFLEANAWLPIATGCALRLRSGRDVAALAAAVAMMALAGQPELVIFATWWLPVWAIAAAVVEAHQAGRSAWWRIPGATLRVLVGLAAGGALAAYQLLPVAAMLGMSNRASGMSWDFARVRRCRRGICSRCCRRRCLARRRLVVLGRRVVRLARTVADVGIVPLLLAAWVPSRWRLACLGSAGLAVLLALGSYAPWYAWTNVWPGYQFRIPSKHLVLAALALALAAGLGLERFRGKRACVGGITAGIALPLVAASSTVWLPWLVRVWPLSDTPQAQAGSATAAVVPLIASVALVGAGVLALTPRVWRRWALVGLAVAELGISLSAFRVTLADPSGYADALQFLRERTRVAVLGDLGGTLGNYGPLLGIEQPTGYTSLFSSGYARLLVGSSDPGVVLTVSQADAPFLGLLGYPVLYDSETSTLIVLNPPSKAAWVAHCARPGGADEARAPGFPLGDCVTLPDAPPDQNSDPPGQAQVTRSAPGQIDLEADGPGWLVTDVPWYPGWSARSDGQSLPVTVLDGALVGVRLSPGRHQVSLDYVPGGLVPGLALSALGRRWGGPGLAVEQPTAGLGLRRLAGSLRRRRQ